MFSSLLLTPLSGFVQRLREQDNGLRKKSLCKFILDIKVHNDFINESFHQNRYRFNEKAVVPKIVLVCDSENNFQ